MARNDQISRIYKILQVLEDSTRGQSVEQLGERLDSYGIEVSKRTLYRDLELLQKAGFPLSMTQDLNEGNQQRSSWTLEKNPNFISPLVLSYRELFVLGLSCLQSQDNVFDKEAARSLNEKILAKLGAKGVAFLKELRETLVFGNEPKTSFPQPILETISAAISEGQTIKGPYSSAHSGQTTERHIGPIALRLSKGSFYLIGQDQGDLSVKIFSLSRFSSVTMTDHKFDSEKHDVSQMMASSFGSFLSPEKSEEICLHFGVSLASFVSERSWHPSQILETQEDGSIYLKLKVGITPDFLSWVLSFGPAVCVLEPESLRVKVGELLEETVEIYRQRRKTA